MNFKLKNLADQYHFIVIKKIGRQFLAIDQNDKEKETQDIVRVGILAVQVISALTFFQYKFQQLSMLEIFSQPKDVSILSGQVYAQEIVESKHPG